MARRWLFCGPGATEITPWGIDWDRTVGGMRKRANDNKSPADPAAAHIEVAFYPYRDDTAVGVTLVRGLGSRAVRMAVWRGTLPCNRSDLHGADSRTVTLLLCGQLWDSLAAPDRHPVAAAADSARGAGSPPLEGPQGEAWTQPCLPLLLDYTHTPPGIDTSATLKTEANRGS